MTAIPRPTPHFSPTRSTPRRRDRRRRTSILVVILGVVLSTIATTGPASAARQWYQVGQLNGGDGPARDSLIINNADVAIFAQYIVGGFGEIRGVRCRYTLRTTTRGLYSDTNWANPAVKNAVDQQNTGVTNRLLAMNIRDSDDNVGRRAGFTGTLQQDHMGVTSFSVCQDPNVVTTSSTPSKRRIAAGSIVGGAVGVAVYAAAAAITVAAGAGAWLGTPVWEAAAGCLAGVAGKIVYDRIANGKVGTAGYYVGMCAVGAAAAAGMVRLAGYFGQRPSFLSDSVLSMGRYALGYTPAIETEGDIEMVMRYLSNR